MPSKFYAVRQGKVPGIYLKWDECKAQVSGHPGAEYKAFSSKDDALAYLKGEEKTLFPQADANTAVAYVDGSFDAKSGKYSYGCVIFDPNGEKHCLSGAGADPEAAVSRNVAGELLGTLNAVKWAVKHDCKHIVICHDYEGIRSWYERRWKAESYVARLYLKYMDSYGKLINISFRKIKAHTGVEFNEEADKLAKAQLGIK